MRPLKDPAEITPLGTRLLVKPYQLPEQTAGGIVIPDSYRDERRWHHYEYVKAPPKALRVLGLDRIHEGAIIRTRFRVPADSGFEDPADGAKLLFINAEDVEQVILWK